MMQQKGFVFLMFCLCAMPVVAADLLADEQGPTASEAVSTVTAGDDFLTPSYVVPADNVKTNDYSPVPSEVDILNEIFGPSDPAKPAVVETKQPLVSASAQKTFAPQKGVQKGDLPLLTPLPPLPVISMEPSIEPKKVVFKQSGYADQALAMAGSSLSGVRMPRELKITFYPNQATFSVQALKWVKSFGVNVVNNPLLLAEIRVSDKNWPIQEKRLSVLLQVLKETGVSVHQIRLYKADRDPDTILIGYADNPKYTLAEKGNNQKGETQKMIDW